jgi:glucokinase
MILAGDIGGTKCNLAMFQEAGEASLQRVFQRRYATRDFSRFEDLIEHFRRQGVEQGADVVSERISAAGFGVAGAVVEGHLHAKNLPWALNPPELACALDVNPENIVLLNDVAATAWSLDKLPAADLAVLNPGVPQPNATRALMAVGTGLGESLLCWDGQRYCVFPSEGGLASFSPRTDREIQLLIYLKRHLPHVCCEDVLSGRGIRAIRRSTAPALIPPVRLPRKHARTPVRCVSRHWMFGQKPMAPKLEILHCAPLLLVASMWPVGSHRRSCQR